MPSHPLLGALLRALCFVGLTEAIFFRLLPAPAEGAGAAEGLIRRMHLSSWQAGSLAFILAYVLVLAVLVTIARTALRDRVWPAGPNGFLVSCLLILVVLGCAAPIADVGPAFATAFTGIAILTLMMMGMHAFVRGGAAVKAFVVCYAAGACCSALLTTGSFASWWTGGSPLPDRILSAADSSGLILIALAGSLALIAFADTTASFASRPVPARLSALTAALAALGFAWLCLVAPDRFSPIGPDPGILAVILIAYGIFAGLLAASMNLIDPVRRTRGYGILLLLLAGYPQRIALQDMLMVAGAALLLAPPPPDPTARLIAMLFGRDALGERRLPGAARPGAMRATGADPLRG